MHVDHVFVKLVPRSHLRARCEETSFFSVPGHLWSQLCNVQSQLSVQRLADASGTVSAITGMGGISSAAQPAPTLVLEADEGWLSNIRMVAPGWFVTIHRTLC
jgi:hypothetical protein